MRLSTATTVGSYFLGAGTVTVAGSVHTWTDDHIGFKIEQDGIGYTLYGTVSDGTEATVTLDSSTVAGAVYEVFAEVDSTKGSVTFYYRKNGGALSAPAVVSTHVPTSNTRIMQVSLSNNSNATDVQVITANATYRR